LDKLIKNKLKLKKL